MTMLSAILSLISSLLLSTTTYIPIESGQVSQLLISVDDLDILRNTSHGFLDAWTLAIKEANRQNIDVWVHVIYKANATLVEQHLKHKGLNFTISEFRTDSVWIRDYGPTLYMKNDVPKLFEYSYYSRRPNDDAEPQAFADFTHLALEDNGIYMEGGNLLTNGEGICVTSDTVLDFNYLDVDFEDRFSMLRDALKIYGCTQTIILESLEEEATGHVDIWLVFANPDTLIAGVFTEEQHLNNAQIQERNMDILRTIFKVVEIPMADPHRAKDGNLVVRTYANLLFLNDVFLVPSYVKHDAKDVIRTIEETTGKKAVIYRGDSIITERGSIHCLSKTIPFVEKKKTIYEYMRDAVQSFKPHVAA